MGKSRLAAQSQEKPPVAKPVSTRSAGKAVDPRGEGGGREVEDNGASSATTEWRASDIPVREADGNEGRWPWQCGRRG
uniref:OSJNBa0029L02.5 protein n=1 Tax=Oryza sativa subsp. japonica TaxID=39947 RepID=Q7XMT2_ORYSJ|nr:OSJNBa0029L02.5 [Oryza sativa Japonica Group]